MNKKVIILSGISGSGKSTFAARDYPGFKLFSADHFFLKEGQYKFDPSKLGHAHADCFFKFIEFIRSDNTALALVDNTNTTVEEISPYMLGSQAYGYEAEIVTISCDVETAAARNTHGVPPSAVWNQYNRLRNRKLPPWWKHSIITSGRD